VHCPHIGQEKKKKNSRADGTACHSTTHIGIISIAAPQSRAYPLSLSLFVVHDLTFAGLLWLARMEPFEAGRALPQTSLTALA
jgi:hypothetical protein